MMRGSQQVALSGGRSDFRFGSRAAQANGYHLVTRESHVHRGDSIVKMRELGGANDRRSDDRLGPLPLDRER
jgi:hypothetical protein